MKIVFASSDRCWVVLDGGYRETSTDRWFEASADVLALLLVIALEILLASQLLLALLR